MFLTELQALTDDLAHRLGSPTVLEDEEQRIIAYSSQNAPIDDVRRDSILRRSTRPEVRDWFRRFGIVASNDPLRIPADPEAGILSRVCVPIRYHGLLLGHLWLIDDDYQLGEPELAIGVEAARHAGLLMYEEVLAHRHAGTILGHLLSPSEQLRSLAAQQANDGGMIEPGAAVAVGVLRLRVVRARSKTLLGEALRDVSSRRPRSELLTVAYPDHGVVLSQARTARLASARALDSVQAAGRAIRTRLAEAGLAEAGQAQAGLADTDVVLGIGDPQPSSYDAYDSYRQARMAANAALVLPELDGIALWSRLGVFRTLAQLPGPEAMRAAIDPRVGSLLRELGVPVLETVERYLDHAGDARATAAELHLSRGTLYYRLNKVEQHSGLDLHDGNDRTSLHLGLKLARFAGCHPASDSAQPRTAFHERG